MLGGAPSQDRPRYRALDWLGQTRRVAALRRCCSRHAACTRRGLRGERSYPADRLLEPKFVGRHPAHLLRPLQRPGWCPTSTAVGLQSGRLNTEVPVAELMTQGRLGHAKSIDYDFTDDRGARVARTGLDVYLVGQVFEGTPTCVKLDHPSDVQTVQKAGQWATVSVTLDGEADKKGRYAAVPGSVRVLANANGEAVKG